jgi:hypothetical protein
MSKGNLKSGTSCVWLPTGILMPSWPMVNDARPVAAGSEPDMRTAAEDEA